MVSNSVILSVCIPTFNRLHYLKEMLEILLPQAETLKVEVCVSDNASTDNTHIFLSDIAKTYNCIKFSVNTTNIGIDLNIINAMQMANGQYLLPIGDDEVLPNGSLNKILQTINVYPNLDVLFLDGYRTNAQLLKTQELLPSNLKGHFFSDPIDALDNLYKFQALGCFVVSRDCLALDWYKKYIGTYHAFCGIIWDFLIFKYQKNKCCSVVCMDELVVLLRVVEKTWKPEFIKIMLHDVPEFISRLPNEYGEVKEKIIKNYCAEKSNLFFLLGYKINHDFDYTMVKKYMKHFSGYQVVRARFVSSMPTVLARFILVLKDCLKMLWIKSSFGNSSRNI